MKKLLLLAAVGYVAYTLGRNAGNRTLLPRPSTHNAEHGHAPPLAADDTIDALAGVAAFDERQVSLANLALGRGIDASTRSLATLLLEEHNTNLGRVRSLGDAVGVPPEHLTSFESPTSDPAFLRLRTLAADDFRTQWLATVTDEHVRMLERIDDLWLPATNDERIAEHLRLVRDDVQMHLQNALALDGEHRAA